MDHTQCKENYSAMCPAKIQSLTVKGKGLVEWLK
jgi:hypothetical protein